MQRGACKVIDLSGRMAAGHARHRALYEFNLKTMIPSSLTGLTAQAVLWIPELSFDSKLKDAALVAKRAVRQSIILAAGAPAARGLIDLEHGFATPNRRVWRGASSPRRRTH